VLLLRRLRATRWNFVPLRDQALRALSQDGLGARAPARFEMAGVHAVRVRRIESDVYVVVGEHDALIGAFPPQVANRWQMAVAGSPATRFQ